MQKATVQSDALSQPHCTETNVSGNTGGRCVTCIPLEPAHPVHNQHIDCALERDVNDFYAALHSSPGFGNMLRWRLGQAARRLRGALVAYQSKSEGEDGVHAGCPLTVGDSTLCCNDRLDDCGVDDTEEECGGIQGTQHVCETSLCCPACSKP